MTPDAWGHVGYVFLIAGTWVVVKRPTAGWLLRVAGSVVWLGVGVAIDMPSIWLWSVVFAGLDLRGAWHAYREPKP